jgi:RNA polymerase sigma-70 factor (ECF subfamily)
MPDPRDSELVCRARAGDRAAYGELVTRYQGHVYGLAYSLAGDWASAQDIAQEAFIRAYTNLDQLREPERFAAWLRRVAFSVAINWLQAFRPKAFEQLDGPLELEELEIPDFRAGPPEAAERRELADAVLRAVASLPPKYRVPLTMFHLDGLSYQKVADFLDIPLGTARSLVHRARERLKAALAAHTTEEIGPMVQEVFDEHKLPPEFAQKVLDNVPALGWGRGRECTFAGALEAALAVTDHPYSYEDVMGLTGLAFRVRWYQGRVGQRWCPSSPVGEGEEEIEAFQRATGWPLRVEVRMGQEPARMEDFAPDIVASINAGRPAPAYDGVRALDMGVVFGYEKGGKTLLVRSYHSRDAVRQPAEKLGPMLLLLGKHQGGMSPVDGLIHALKIAVGNWRRPPDESERGAYLFGEAALAQWAEDLGEVNGMTDEEKGLLFFVNSWNYISLHDARDAAREFLEARLDLVRGTSRAALERAAAHYRREAELLAAPLRDGNAFLGAWTGKKMADWTDDVRRREAALLAQVRQIEGQAVAQMDAALKALP